MLVDTTPSLSGYATNQDIAINHINGSYYIFNSDLLWVADANIGVLTKQPRTIIFQSNGLSQISTLGTITGTSILGSTTRIGVVPDPLNGTKNCWYLRADSSDADTAGVGNKRSELLASSDSEIGSMKMNTAYVIGCCQRVADWTSTTDQQATWQIHDNAASSLSPWVALLYEGNTRKIYIRYSLNASPTQGNTTAELVWSQTGWTPNIWDKWVIKVVESQTNGLAQVWLNGTLLFTYNGPLGYQEPNNRGSYWKQGIYHWTDAGNTWDASLSMRETWQKGAYISNQVSAEEMISFLDTL